MRMKVNRQVKAGRPKGRRTMFKGIMGFCASTGYSHQHVRRVLKGLETSAPVSVLWAAWEQRNGRAS